MSANQICVDVTLVCIDGRWLYMPRGSVSMTGTVSKYNK